jgi:hypothetical protein
VARELLQMTADEYQFSHGEGGQRFRLVKRLSDPLG